MYPRILRRVRDLILNGQYVVTSHAYDEMAADDLTIWDVERAVLTGSVVERQKDARTAELKYRLRGDGVDDVAMELILRIGPTGKVIIITVYAL